MSEFYKGQAVREVKTGRRWYITATYPRSVTVQKMPLRNTEEPWGGREKAFKREEISPDDQHHKRKACQKAAFMVYGLLAIRRVQEVLFGRVL